MVERAEKHLAVNVDLMNEAKAADEDLWIEYIDMIYPDDRDHLLYSRWLCLTLARERKKRG